MRARWWNYGWNGAYFITICTKNRKHLFGEIVKNEMKLSHLGVISYVLWHEIPHHVPFVELGDFVVMPNHIHGILIIDKPVAQGHALALQDLQANRFQNIGKETVSSIIGSYKSAVTKYANQLGLESGWQIRFHDHIIRNDASYERISNYIVTNPENWDNDKFNDTKNL